MSSGYCYGQNEPVENCPICYAEFVDVGVGNIQSGPYLCEECHAIQISPYDYDEKNLTEEEKHTGWYAPDPEWKK